MKSTFLMIVLSQIVLIILLIFFIFFRKNISSKPVIIPINKEAVKNNPTSSLTYFYEPKSESVENVNEWGPYNGNYSINKDTLHERFNYKPKKNPQAFRIITLGDSYTYGLYVDTKDNWTEGLEDALNEEVQCSNITHFEVINLGVHGYDIQSAVERFKLRGSKYKPDIVLWLIKSDDLIQLNEVMGKKLASYKPTTGYSNWSRAMTETVEELGEDNIINLQQKYIESFLQIYKGQTVFMTFPKIRNFPYKKIEYILNEHKDRTDFLYLEDIYQSEQNFYKNDYHPTVVGHEVIAEDVFNYLKNGNIIPCN